MQKKERYKMANKDGFNKLIDGWMDRSWIQNGENIANKTFNLHLYKTASTN